MPQSVSPSSLMMSLRSSQSLHQYWGYSGWGTTSSCWGESTSLKWPKWKENKAWLKICLTNRRKFCKSSDTKHTMYFPNQLGSACFSQTGVPLLHYTRHHRFSTSLLSYWPRILSSHSFPGRFSYIYLLQHLCPNSDHPNIPSSSLLLQIWVRTYFQDSISMLYCYRIRSHVFQFVGYFK